MCGAALDGSIPVTLANRITIGRLLLIPVFVVLLMSYTRDQPWLRHAALIVYIAGAASDAVDRLHG